MILSRKEFFTREHFESHKGVAPAYLCELVVYCLELVSQLVYHGLGFRFKGGNSLLVMLQDPQRFSIDVDIVTTVTKEYLMDLIKKIVEEAGLFSSYDIRQHKTKPWLPMISFNLFFRSFYKKEGDSFVMLDCVLEEPPYAGIKKQVKCGTLYESGQMVEVPTVSGLIADKLLTIGPAVLGIPLGKNKEAQRLKHVFDIALLLRQNDDLHDLKKNLNNCISQENLLQKHDFQLSDIIEDTKNFCTQPLEFREKPQIAVVSQKSYLYEIVKGFDEFKNYLFKIDYTWQEFQNNCRAILKLLESL